MRLGHRFSLVDVLGPPGDRSGRSRQSGHLLLGGFRWLGC